MKIGLYLETTYSVQNNTLFCDDIYINTFDQIALDNKFSYGVLARFRHDSEKAKYELKACNSFSSLGLYKSIPYFILSYTFLRDSINDVISLFVKDNDLLFIMAPSPISNLILNNCYKFNKSVILIIRQDLKELVKYRYNFLVLPFANLFVNYYESKLLNFIKLRNTSLVVTGSILLNKYKKYTNNIYNFIDSRFSETDIPNPEYLKILKDKNNNCTKIIYVGKLEKNKGIFDLIKIIKFFPKNVELSIVGDGEDKNTLVRLITKYKVDKIVKLYGFIPPGELLFQKLKESDVFLFPSYSEGLPQVILEAMVCGCFVISSDVGSISSVIVNQSNGVLCRPGMINQFVFALNEFINNKYRNSEYIIFSNEIVKLYTQEKQLLIFKQLLTEILNKSL